MASLQSLLISLSVAIMAAANGCVVKSGASISIISPAQDASYTAGSPLTITWNILGAETNPAYKTIVLHFSIANATNPNNVIPLFPLPGSPLVGDGQLQTTIPATVPTGTKYAVEAQYQDAANNNENMLCFSPVITVQGVAPSVVSTTGGATVVQTTVAPVKTTSGVDAVTRLGMLGMVAWLLI